MKPRNIPTYLNFEAGGRKYKVIVLDDEEMATDPVVLISREGRDGYWEEEPLIHVHLETGCENSDFFSPHVTVRQEAERPENPR